MCSLLSDTHCSVTLKLYVHACCVLLTHIGPVLCAHCSVTLKLYFHHTMSFRKGNSCWPWPRPTLQVLTDVITVIITLRPILWDLSLEYDRRQWSLQDYVKAAMSNILHPQTNATVVNKKLSYCRDRAHLYHLIVRCKKHFDRRMFNVELFKGLRIFYRQCWNQSA